MFLIAYHFKILRITLFFLFSSDHFYKFFEFFIFSNIKDKMNCLSGPTALSSPPSHQTASPHHIPGYSGYVPQQKFQDGYTYGSTSHKILLDPCISSSPRSVLNPIYPGNCGDDGCLPEPPCNSTGRQFLGPNKYPNYTGFSPYFQTVLGHSRAPTCQRVVGVPDFGSTRDKIFHKELESLDSWRFCYKKKPWENQPDCGSSPELSDFGRAEGVFPAGRCGCQPGTMLADSIMMKVGRTPIGSGGPCCGNLDKPADVMSSGYSVCDYAQRRIWGAAQEPMMRCTAGDIIPKTNVWRFTQ